MPSIAYDHPTTDHNLVDICGRCGVRDLIGMGSRGAHGVGSNNDEISKSSIGDIAAVGPAQAVVACFAPDHDQLRRGEAAAFPSCQPLVELEPPQLLERVDNRMLIRAESQRAAGVDQPSSGADAIGKITFCRWTKARRRLATTQCLDVGVGEVGGMYRRSVRAEQAVIIKQLGRSATVKGSGSGVFGRLLAEMNMQGPLSCRFTDGAESFRGHRSNRVHRAPYAYLIKITEQAHPGPPVINIAVCKTCLDGIQWQMAGCIKPASE